MSFMNERIRIKKTAVKETQVFQYWWQWKLMFFYKNIRSRSTARETDVFCQSALKEYMSFMKERMRNKKTAVMEKGVFQYSLL